MFIFLSLLLPPVLSLYCRNIHYEGEGVKHYQDTFGYERLILIGDLHSDIGALNRIIHYTRASNLDTIIALGDSIGRGNHTQEVLNFFMMAPNALLIIGNHENMNMDRGYSYVSPADTLSFGGMDERIKEFTEGGKYYEFLKWLPVVVKIGDLTLVHGGISAKLAEKYKDIEEINKIYLKERTLLGAFGPLWYRAYGVRQEGAACPELYDALSSLNSKFMIMGHTLYPNITARCKGKAVFIDTGISYAVNSTLSALEVIQSQGRTLQMKALYPSSNKIIYSSFE